jgi:DNA-binding CsgD family transcriptional regulator
MLLERDRELQTLDDLLADLGSSGGKVVLVRGEAGIGKTALVRELVATHSDDLHAHVGGCDDLLIPQPFGPFWDMARLEDSLRGPLEDADRPRLLEAIMALLSRSLRPTVIVIEDTHWADEATLDAIKYLGRRIGSANGLLVLTYRTGELDYDHPLRGVIGDLPSRDVVGIQLGGLSLDAVSAIVGDMTLDPEAVLAATAGNPFLVEEMISADEVAVSSSLQDSVMARVRKLSRGAQQMLKTLAVIPEPIPTSDALGLKGASEHRLDECERRGLLHVGTEMVGFRHDLTRRAVETALTGSERLARNRAVLKDLPEDTHPCLIIHCAVEANDIDRLVVVAPRSARYAAAMGSHRLAVDDFRQLAPYLDRLDPEDVGPLLGEWAREEFLIDNIDAAISLNETALSHHRRMGDASAESRALAQGSHFYENAGQRERAEASALHAIDVLGPDADGADLAQALEANAYLAMMAGNVTAVPDLVDRTLAAGGPDIDQRILIRSLNHRGIVANIANYPDGRGSLDEARERSEAAGRRYEECRALLNHAWAALEFRDLPIASDYAQRAIASAARHELDGLERYSVAIYARVLELKGEWDEAMDLARSQLAASAITQMVVLPIVGVIEARRGRVDAGGMLAQAWEMASVANETQRLAPAAIAIAEHAWIVEDRDIPVLEIKQVMDKALDAGFTWSPGSVALWLWKLGELSEAPAGIAEPYRLLIEGKPMDAAERWAEIGCPYERAIALAHGDTTAQLAAVEVFDTLGATAVAAKLRKALRSQGLSVPRGRGQKTRDHGAGLTARQAEILELLSEGFSNTEIADRLFVSPRTVEHHVSALLAKLDSSNRAEAVQAASRQGLLASR